MEGSGSGFAILSSHMHTAHMNTHTKITHSLTLVSHPGSIYQSPCYCAIYSGDMRRIGAGFIHPPSHKIHAHLGAVPQSEGDTPVDRLGNMCCGARDSGGGRGGHINGRSSGEEERESMSAHTL